MDNFAKELLDDDALDPKKLFDEKQYSTLIINRDGFNKKQNSLADQVESLLDPTITREESEAIFTALKEAESQKFLIDSIKAANRIEDKAALTAACWESGLDFTDHYLFFVELACSAEFLLAMEALTVVENCDGTVPETILIQAMALVQDSKSKNKDLLEDLSATIKSKTN